MRYNFDNIPDCLRQRDQWLLWDPDKVPKQPSGAHAKTNDLDTLSSFSLVREVYESQRSGGIGFVFTEDDPYGGLDLDGCYVGSGFESSHLTDGAGEIIERVDSYTEVSPSGTGVHIIFEGSVPDFGNRTGDVPGMKELEIYGFARYFTVTGWHLEGTPSVLKSRSDEIYSLCEDFFKDPERPSSKAQSPHNLSDERLIEKAKSADDGGKFERLWGGDTTGYKSHSEAQQALANKLAFWTGGEKVRMLRLFNNSGMPRGGDDLRKFRDHDMETALDGRTGYYNPEGASRVKDEEPHGGDEATGEGSIDSESAGPGEGIRSLYEDDKKQARVEVSDLLIEKFNLATHRESKHLYWWDEENYVYTRGGKEVVWSWLTEKLGKHFSKHELREIITRIKGLTHPSEFGADGFVPVANGDLKITEDEVDLKEPTPERGFRNRSKAEWHLAADAPRFRDFFLSVVPREVDRKTLQEYVGYALMHWGLPYHKALFIVGPQASGKSTFLAVVCYVLGKTTRLSPQQLVEGRFGAAELEDSWANVSSDIPTALQSNVGRFKEITAGDQIHVERKFEQGYTIQPTTKHLYSANQLPEIKIDDDAFFRRVLIIPFPRTVPKEERIPSLADKLKLEANGILRWAVEGLKRLLKNQEFTGDLSPSETRRLWEEHASSIGKFKIRRLNVTGRDEDAVAKEDLYSAYAEFCMEKGLAAESQQKLTRVLKRDPKIGDADRTPPGWDQQTSCYTGVQVSEGEKEAPN
jgi:P4 family phage/plasmid primase-like protien